MSLYYTVYVMTNEINGIAYIGAHQTGNLEDGYTGSGVALNRAIQKYGLTSFRRDVVEFLSSADAMYEKERELIAAAGMNGIRLYNRSSGGEGWGGVNENLTNSERSRIGKIGGSAHRNPEALRLQAERGAARFRLMHKNGMHRYDTFSGRSHTEETRAKMSLHGRSMIGSLNSQYGTHWKWIHSPHGEMRKIPLEDLIPEGWEPRRK